MRRICTVPLFFAATALFAAGCTETESSGSDTTTTATTTTTTTDSTPPVVTRRPSEPVSPLFVGSGGFAYGFGSAFPGATAPAGFVKVGPDTKGPWGTVNFLHFSGYWYGDDQIQGFSHMHLHGTGATDYGVLSLMPSDGFDASRTTPDGYGSTFKKSTEKATPGLYAVTLDRGGIDVQITASRRGAVHKYTYPLDATSAHVIVDLDHHLSGGTIDSAEATLSQADGTITGKLHSTGGMSGGFGGYEVYFAMKAKSPWKTSTVWQNGEAPSAGAAVNGTGAGFDLEFDLSASPGGPVVIAVALSMVSEQGAADNLAAEVAGPNPDFEAVLSKTSAEWSDLTGRVTWTGGLDEDRVKMEAALYHLYLMPSIQSDADGSFTAMDGSVQKEDKFHYMTDMSLWDTYRTLHPMYDLIAPEYAKDSVESLIAKAKAGGFFPKWPIATGEAGTMLGSSAEVVLADAAKKGIPISDLEGAYQILSAAAMSDMDPPGGRGGRDAAVDYMKYGYVPSTHGRSVSMTTEYANDDLGLAVIADMVGQGAQAAALRERAKGYRQLFDPETGFLWAKDETGAWSTDHADPTHFSEEYAEANAWQSLWMVAEDADGLAELFGGKDKAVAKLEEFFDAARADYEGLDYGNPITANGMRPYYWGANEPDINAPYLFAQLGRPDLTQKWVAWCRAFLYTAGADGLPGNDDGGTMSAWFVFSALGFYPIPATDRYVIGAPLFPHAEVHLGQTTFTVEAKDVSDENVYVQSVKLNGKPLEKPEILHGDLLSGGTLEFEMGPAPSDWGK
ncbi:MAG: GH92 family glycosyl hydrolase [Polyangiaceae bacterium]